MMTDTLELNPLLKLALGIGTLLLLFFADVNTAVFETFVDPMIPETAVHCNCVVLFGGLTLVLQHETFIKLKPTIIYLLFTGVLFGGLIFRKPLLAMVFDQMFHLTDEGWRKLTLRWALFFLALAVLNEIVWRTQTTDVWVSFKVFGVVPLTFVFAALQYPLLTKYTVPESAKEESSSG